MLCGHDDGRLQLSFCQAPPVHDTVIALAGRPVSLLATCAGYLLDAHDPLRQLCAAPAPCARPYMNETGGIWLQASPATSDVPRRQAAGYRAS
jgi:hypothetical protein